MRNPRWLSEKIAKLGKRVLSGEIGYDSAVAALMDAMLADKTMTASLAADRASGELGRWLRRQDATADVQNALFPGLSAALDVAPGAMP